MTSASKDQSPDQNFHSAREADGWTDRPVEEDTVLDIYDLMKWTPTSANSSERPKLMPHAAEVMQLWTDADRLFAVFGLVTAAPVQGG